MKKILFLLPLFFLSNSIIAQTFNFFKEEIIFEIDPVFFTVNGDYYFKNNSDQTIFPLISYPVRSNGIRKPFDTIMVYDNSDPSTALKLIIIDTVARFTIKLLPFSEKMIKVIYKQKHNGTDARYILLTTRSWNKPINEARYSVVVRRNIEINQFSISPDKSVDFGDTTVYYWRRKNFMPDKDFEMHFRVDGK